MRRLLDTNIVLYLLAGRLDEELPEGEYFVSVISELELLSFSGLDSDGEAAIRSFLDDVTVVDLDRAIKDETIRIRRALRLKLPDAIVVASAVSLKAELLTCDERLLRLAGVPARALRLRP